MYAAAAHIQRAATFYKHRAHNTVKRETAEMIANRVPHVLTSLRAALSAANNVRASACVSVFQPTKRSAVCRRGPHQVFVVITSRSFNAAFARQSANHAAVTASMVNRNEPDFGHHVSQLSFSLIFTDFLGHSRPPPAAGSPFRQPLSIFIDIFFQRDGFQLFHCYARVFFEFLHARSYFSFTPPR